MSLIETVDPYDWETVAPYYEALLAEELTPQSAHDWLRRWSDLERVVAEAGTAASRAMSENTADEAAKKTYLDFLQEVEPPFQVFSQALRTKLLMLSGFTPSVDETHLLKRLQSEAALFREANVSLGTEVEAVATQYDEIVGSMTVVLDGQEFTLQQAEQRCQEPNRADRETAWRAAQERWLQDRAALDALFLKLRELRQQLARNADMVNYRAYRWQELQRFDYTPDDSMAFGRAIEQHVVPLAAERRERRRRLLGLDTLRPWDLSVDASSQPPLRPFNTIRELEEGAARIFGRLDPELAQEYARLRHGFLDLESRRNKAPGGYCSFFAKTGLPYIFMNAVGTHDDVQTLLHECGHAFHDLESSACQALIWNVGAPSEFAEVGSMGMELLASPYLEAANGGFYSAAEADRARAEHLEKVIQFFPYMAVVDGFQHWVYAEAGDGVTATELDRRWEALWERFLPGGDWNGLEAERMTGWHRKMHLYQHPFYYVEYGLAQLGALQVWRNALTDEGAALRAYRNALALGNTRPLPELFAAAGARLAFDGDTVQELMALVASHLPD